MRLLQHRSTALTAPALTAALVAALVAGSGAPTEAAPALGAEARIEAQVSGLLGRMTLAEKFGQLEMYSGDFGTGKATPEQLELARRGLLGSTLNVRGAANVNELQRAASQSRLKIPVLPAFDVIHGYRTVFPVNLAQAGSFDPALVQNAQAVAAREAAAAGLALTFGPMADLSHDPRWGRIVEGAGEDPYLGAAMAAAQVRGFQGPTLRDIARPDRVAATVKHFAAYGGVESGREYNTVDVSTERLYNLYLPPYRAAVQAGAASVMPSFNDINGVPSTANPALLRDILRREWGFAGPTVSDYTAVHELVAHGFAADPADAARLALSAGTDIEMVSTDYSTYGPRLVASGRLAMSDVDNAVRRVLRLKFLAGLFDDPFADPAREAAVTLTPANRAAARATAGQSMVLLKNENRALPLATGTKRIAVVGPLADNQPDLLGPWSGDGLLHPTDVVTVRSGIANAVPGATVSYAQGCDTDCTSTAGFAAAARAARDADVTVLVVGESQALSGEASSRSDLGLPGRQQELVDAVAATGKPYVVVLMNGRPLTIGALAERAPAVLEAWFGGTEAGNAVADVLFGKVNPSAKLPVSFPRNVGQIPVYYNHRNTGRPADPDNKYTSKYLDVPNSPLYPFGYGLSYTDFTLSGLRLSAPTVSDRGVLRVSATLRNTGSVAGSDVVQVYLHDKVASITQPVRRLTGFQKVTLAPGASKVVTFSLNAGDFGFYDNSARFRVEPGEFDVWVGDSSVGGLPGSFTVTR